MHSSITVPCLIANVKIGIILHACYILTCICTNLGELWIIYIGKCSLAATCNYSKCRAYLRVPLEPLREARHFMLATVGTCYFHCILAVWEEGFDHLISFLLPQCFHHSILPTPPHSRARPISEVGSSITHAFWQRSDTVSLWFKDRTPGMWRSIP